MTYSKNIEEIIYLLTENSKNLLRVVYRNQHKEGIRERGDTKVKVQNLTTQNNTQSTRK